MGVRIRVRVESTSTGRSATTSALVSTGFESGRPTLRLPMGLAREIGLSEEDLGEAETAEFVVGDGRLAHFALLRDAFRVSVITEDRVEGPVLADAIVLGGPGELVLSDALIQLLKVVPVLPHDGLWRFVDEPPDRPRISVRRRIWGL
ncbi:hypothetical protein DRO32_02940 [Candidatus Bathyarchaeota archaeon]|nr:MAG: hypothetical protein DRO32_02940 [Candidatus Bathyarchaeota archaeon]